MERPQQPPHPSTPHATRNDPPENPRSPGDECGASQQVEAALAVLEQRSRRRPSERYRLLRARRWVRLAAELGVGPLPADPVDVAAVILVRARAGRNPTSWLSGVRELHEAAGVDSVAVRHRALQLTRKERTLYVTPRVPTLNGEERRRVLETLQAAEDVKSRMLLLFFVVGAYCGRRPNEVIGLGRDDIWVDDGRVFVRSRVLKRRGRPHETFLLVDYDGIVDVAALVQWRQSQPGEELVFPGRSRRNLARSAMREIAERCGLPTAAPSSLRRTLATEWASQAVPVERIQAQLSHQSSVTTRGYIAVDQRNASANRERFVIDRAQWMAARAEVAGRVSTVVSPLDLWLEDPSRANRWTSGDVGEMAAVVAEFVRAELAEGVGSGQARRLWSRLRVLTVAMLGRPSDLVYKEFARALDAVGVRHGTAPEPAQVVSPDRLVRLVDSCRPTRIDEALTLFCSIADRFRTVPPTKMLWFGAMSFEVSAQQVTATSWGESVTVSATDGRVFVAARRLAALLPTMSRAELRVMRRPFEQARGGATAEVAHRRALMRVTVTAELRVSILLLASVRLTAMQLFALRVDEVTAQGPEFVLAVKGRPLVHVPWVGGPLCPASALAGWLDWRSGLEPAGGLLFIREGGEAAPVKSLGARVRFAASQAGVGRVTVADLNLTGKAGTVARLAAAGGPSLQVFDEIRGGAMAEMWEVASGRLRDPGRFL